MPPNIAISVLAGKPKAVGSRDASLANSTFNRPSAIAQVSANQFVVCDSENYCLRLIDTQDDCV